VSHSHEVIDLPLPDPADSLISIPVAHHVDTRLDWTGLDSIALVVLRFPGLGIRDSSLKAIFAGERKSQIFGLDPIFFDSLLFN
jgi:hypothetical protein